MKKTGKGKELAKNTIIMLIGKLFTQFLSFFLLPLYTRRLSTEEYGTVDLILTYITLLAPVVTIQQEMATFRFLVDVRGNIKKEGEIIKTSIRKTTQRLLIFLTIAIGFAIYFKSLYALLVIACGITMAFSHLLLQIARGLGDNTKYTIGSVIAGVVTLASNLLLICKLGVGGESILISMTVANIACLAYLLISLRLPSYYNNSKTSKTLAKQMTAYSLPLVPNGISWWLINASDRTIVSTFLGVSMNGIYAVATKFPSILNGILNIFSLSWSESASLHIDDEDRDSFFSNVANTSLRIFSSLGNLVIAALPFVFNIIIGNDYLEAYNYIPIAMMAVMFGSLVSIYSAIYVAKKITKKVATTSIVSAIINIVVDIALIRFIGLYASVVSTLIAYASMTIYRHLDVKKYVKIKYNKLDLIIATISTAITSFAYYSRNLQLIGGAFIISTIIAIAQNRQLIKKLLKSNKMGIVKE